MECSDLIKGAVGESQQLCPAVGPAVQEEGVGTDQQNKPQEQVVNCHSPDFIPTAGKRPTGKSQTEHP